MMKISVIINNYNYGRYLRQCLESALNQTHPFDEVILVDDGSTDDSRSIAANYSAQITIINQENGGQASAMNTGFQGSSSDLILFLDADDFLHPSAAEQIMQAWQPAYAKMQFRLTQVDEQSRTTGELPSPGQRLPASDVREQLLTQGRYGSMPTSANVFSRQALERIMPIPERGYRTSADLFLSILITRHGEIGALEQALGSYRVHSQNCFHTGALITLDHRQLTNRVQSHLRRSELLAQENAREGRQPTSLPLVSIPGWIDRMIAHRLGLDEQTGDNATMTQLSNGLHQTINSRYPNKPLYRLCGALMRLVLQHFPLAAIRLLGSLERRVPYQWKSNLLQRAGIQF
ncbi:glycosyltransferase family 2 protein [Cerasicoccus arenae]|uniref:Glycosyltransferase 2-like domain-containing protein n=1 Tax=Cerasicoccus arenae TaxID=424488 RepID=A0A8J3DBP0_9BACT|nr:glycosyltransferase family 2 protein [Cerasicoccus arenae]MBK1858056.1 glycosyltransferase family 2 protein [Cerasicoccus arenae]GHC06791.1 hypothetical protein GCM10007047_24790 [Cerasicoccus arenae]